MPLFQVKIFGFVQERKKEGGNNGVCVCGGGSLLHPTHPVAELGPTGALVRIGLLPYPACHVSSILSHPRVPLQCENLHPPLQPAQPVLFNCIQSHPPHQQVPLKKKKTPKKGNISCANNRKRKDRFSLKPLFSSFLF